MQYPIERYVIELARRLPLDAAETAAIVEEVRAHLEEAAAHALEDGMDCLAAEEQAVAAFGLPDALARQLASTHPARWRVRHVLGAGLLGGVVVWVLWTATAYPLVVNNVLGQLAYNSSWPDKTGLPLHLLVLSTPLSLVSVGELTGQHWLLLVLLLYLVLPYVWGLRARRWWLPGLAYGLGAVLLNPVTYGVFFQLSTPEIPWLLTMSMLALAGLPLAVLASGLGAGWRVCSSGLMARGRAVVLAHLPRRPLVSASAQRAMLQPPRRVLVSLSRRRLKLRWVVIGLLLLAILAVEIVSFARIWSAAQQPALTPAQQLAQAQAHTPFPIRQPAFLPTGAHLSQVFFDHCSVCGSESSSSVELIYALAVPGADVQLDESNARIAPPEGSYEDGAGHLHPLAVSASMLSLGGVSAMVLTSTGAWSDGSPFYRYDILWAREGIFYLLSSMDTPAARASLDDLEQMAASIQV